MDLSGKSPQCLVLEQYRIVSFKREGQSIRIIKNGNFRFRTSLVSVSTIIQVKKGRTLFARMRIIRYALSH